MRITGGLDQLLLAIKPGLLAIRQATATAGGQLRFRTAGMCTIMWNKTRNNLLKNSLYFYTVKRDKP